MIREGAHLLDGVSYSLRCRFEIAAQRADAVGIDLRITSGYRSTGEQQHLRDRWETCQHLDELDPREREALAATCRGVLPAAMPGSSMHERGLALDVVPICTPFFANWYVQRYSSTAHPVGPSSGLDMGPVNIDPAVDCSRVPSFALLGGTGFRGVWDTILEGASLVRPYPADDPVHIEPCELPALRAAGLV